MIGYAEWNGLMHFLLCCASAALGQTAFPFTKKVIKKSKIIDRLGAMKI